MIKCKMKWKQNGYCCQSLIEISQVLPSIKKNNIIINNQVLKDKNWLKMTSKMGVYRSPCKDD